MKNKMFKLKNPPKPNHDKLHLEHALQGFCFNECIYGMSFFVVLSFIVFAKAHV